MKRGRLPVHVEPGLFSSERTISFQADGRTYALIVDAEDVQEDAIEVYVLQEENGRALIHLPRETLNAGSRVVVPAASLLPAGR